MSGLLLYARRQCTSVDTDRLFRRHFVVIYAYYLIYMMLRGKKRFSYCWNYRTLDTVQRKAIIIDQISM